MRYYKLGFYDKANHSAKFGYVKCELGQNYDDLIGMLAMEDVGMTVQEMREQFEELTVLNERQAEREFGASAYTVRRRYKTGDFFVAPGHETTVPVSVTIYGPDDKKQLIQMQVPYCVVNDDCNGEALKRLLQDAAGYGMDDPKQASWTDFANQSNGVLSKFGVKILSRGTMLDLCAWYSGPIASESRMEQTVTVSKNTARRIEKFLTGAEEFGENESYSETVRFPDGMQMDVKCNGNDDGPAWTEAVLFEPNGAQAGMTEPEDEFLGDWEIEAYGRTYIVHVEIEKDEQEIAKALSELRQSAYRKYQLDWMASMGLGVSDAVTELFSHARSVCDPEDKDTSDIARINPAALFAEWEILKGFENSGKWRTFHEFIQCEYKQKDIMRRLLTPEEFALYETDKLAKS